MVTVFINNTVQTTFLTEKLDNLAKPEIQYLHYVVSIL